MKLIDAFGLLTIMVAFFGIGTCFGLWWGTHMRSKTVIKPSVEIVKPPKDIDLERVLSVRHDNFGYWFNNTLYTSLDEIKEVYKDRFEFLFTEIDNTPRFETYLMYVRLKE